MEDHSAFRGLPDSVLFQIFSYLTFAEVLKVETAFLKRFNRFIRGSPRTFNMSLISTKNTITNGTRIDLHLMIRYLDAFPGICGVVFDVPYENLLETLHILVKSKKNLRFMKVFFTHKVKNLFSNLIFILNSFKQLRSLSLECDSSFIKVNLKNVFAFLKQLELNSFLSNIIPPCNRSFTFFSSFPQLKYLKLTNTNFRNYSETLLYQLIYNTNLINLEIIAIQQYQLNYFDLSDIRANRYEETVAMRSEVIALFREIGEIND